jgi:hypothetical protein
VAVTERSRRRRVRFHFALAFSWIFNPIVFCTGYLAAEAWTLGRRALLDDVLLFLLLALLPGVLLLIGIAAGWWSDWDVSELAERRRYMPAVLGLAVIAAVMAWFDRFPAPLRVAATAIAIWLVISTVVGLTWKISLHMGGSTGIVWLAALTLHPAVALAIAWVPAVVAWARVVLHKHTWAQVVAGAAAGTIAVLSAALLVGSGLLSAVTGTTG